MASPNTVTTLHQQMVYISSVPSSGVYRNNPNLFFKKLIKFWPCRVSVAALGIFTAVCRLLILSTRVQSLWHVGLAAPRQAGA